MTHPDPGLSTEEVRRLFAEGWSQPVPRLFDRGKDLFDQWLAEHDRQLRADEGQAYEDQEETLETERALTLQKETELHRVRTELAEEKAGRLTWQERAEELSEALTAAQARAGEAEAELAREIEIRDDEDRRWRDIYRQTRREREEARAEVARLKADCNTRADAWTQGWSAGLADSTCSHPTALTPNPYRARADGEAGL